MSTFLDEPFDIDNEEGTKFDLIPVSTRIAEIIAATVAPTASGRGQAIKLKWSLTQDDANDEYKGRLVFQQLNIQHDSEKAQKIGREQFKDICFACGLMGLLEDLNDLLFKPCAVRVAIEKDKTGSYPDKNKIGSVKPIAAMATPEQVRQQQEKDAKKDLLKEASKTPPAFKASDEDMNDELPGWDK
jgi:Protein of unknown function (DUF669)